MNLERIAKYRKGLAVERLHTIRHITPYNNGSHSANAALLAHEVCVANGLNSASVVLYMLMHDVSEGYVGDCPANVKWDNPGLAAELKAIEHRWEGIHLEMPELSWQELDIAKLADYAELGMYCLEELALGNTLVSPVLHNIVKVLQKYNHIMGCPEILENLITRGEI